MSKIVGIVLVIFVCMLQYASTYCAGSNQVTDQWEVVDISADGKSGIALRPAGGPDEWDYTVNIVDIVDYDGPTYTVVDTLHKWTNVYQFCNDSMVVMDVAESVNRSFVTRRVGARGPGTMLLEYDLRDTATWWMEYMDLAQIAIQLSGDTLVAYRYMTGVCVRQIHADNRSVELGFASDCEWPSIAPDGTEVYFVRTRQEVNGRSQIAIVAFDVEGEYNYVITELEEPVLYEPRGLGKNSPVYYLQRGDDTVGNVWACNRDGDLWQVSKQEYPQTVEYFWLTKSGVVCWVRDLSEKRAWRQRLRLYPLTD